MLKITKNQGSIQVTADQSGFYPFDGTITFPTNSLFTCAQNNTDMITFKSTSNGDVQFVGNYKDITISGRSYDTKQKFLTAFSNLANQGSVDAYTKAETDAKIDAKQGKLKAGDGITLTEDATDNTTVVKTAVSLTDNGNGAYTVGDSIKMGDGIAIGKNASGHNDSITVGYSARATKSYCTVIGNGARATNYNCTVIGEDASALNDYCTVIGTDAHSHSHHSVAVGYSAFIDSNSHHSIAVGYSAQSHGENSVAIGKLSNANKDNPLVIKAGYKTVDNVKQPLTVLQSDSNGKISLLKGDGTNERMVIQDEIEALKNAGGSGGTVDAYTKAETDNLLNAKQNTLTAGTGITIDENNVISSTGGSGGTVEGLAIDADKITAGFEQHVTSSTGLVVIGNKAKAEAESSYSVLIGQEANAHGYGSTAIGFGAGCKSNNYTIAVGYYATTEGAQTIAIGKSAEIQGGYGDVIIGSNTKSTNGGKAIAIGYEAKTSARYGLSIGYGAETNDTTPLVIKAGKDSNYNPLTVLQSDSTGKLSILKGDGTDERIVIQDALSAGGSGGSVDAYTKTETDAKLDAKQDKLTAGSGITITKDETAGTSTIATAVSLTDNGNGAYTVGDSIKIGDGIAIGEYAYSMGYNGIAVGPDAHASGEGAVAIGHYSVATNDNPLVIRAGYKIIGNSKKTLTVLQSDSNGKISIIKGDDPDERIVISDEITALKAEITTLKAEIAALKGGASTGDTTGA